jgi:hypothetical protein
MLIEIYRGILDTLHQNNATLRDDVKKHIRSFDAKIAKEDKGAYICYGFWRMMLESFLNIYIHISLGFGILLTLLLCLIAWPFTFLLTMYTNVQYARIQYIEVDQGPGPTMDPLDPYHLEQNQVNKEKKRGTPRSNKTQTD